MPLKNNSIIDAKQSNALVGVIAGDNIFTYILARNALSKFKISSVILSKYNSGSVKNIYSIFKKTSLPYFCYRSAVQIISKIYSNFSIKKWARKNDVSIFSAKSKKELSDNKKSNEITIAFNFDIIVPTDFIKQSKLGVLNIHASDIPSDRGISPVVWSYCRGDNKLCITYYLMDGGIDTGKILKKTWVEIKKEWSLFRTYCEVLDLASKELIDVVEATMNNSNNVSAVKDDSESSYNSWPDAKLHKLLKKNNRSYFHLSDFAYLNKLLKS